MEVSLGIILTSALMLLLLNGCITTFTTEYIVDLESEREWGTEDDLKLLRPEEPVSLPEPLTLDDAVRIGLKNNLDMRISRIMAEVDDDQALSKRLQMLPNANFSGSASQSNVMSDEDQDIFQKSANLSITWNILNFGISYIRARQTALRSEIKRMERIRQAQVLASDISESYWKTILAEQSLEELHRMMAEIREYKEKAEVLVAQKRLDPIASKSIEKKMIELAMTAENLQSEISGAKIQLCKLMGLDPMTEITLKREPFRDYLKKMPVPESLEPRKMEMLSLHNRPELFTADLDIRIQQEEARASLLSMFPGLSFNFSTHYNSNSSYANNMWFTWGGNIAWSLLSLPSKYYNLTAQEKSVEMVKLRRLMLTASVIVQTHIALHNYIIKIRQFRLHDESFAINKELLDMSRERHELGLLSSWALTQRMLEEVVARLGRDRRIIDLLNTYNMLMVTLGLEYDRWGDNLPDMNEKALPEDIDYRDIREKFKKEKTDISEEYEGGFYYKRVTPNVDP